MTTTYVSTAEHAAQIRAALKKLGITSRQVSVTSQSFSLGSSIRVKIKDPTVKLATVKEIADAHEKVDRCSMSGEILSGGNRYLSVGYTEEAKDALAKPLMEATEKAMEAAKAKPGHCIPITEKASLSSDSARPWLFTLWIDQDGDGGGTPQSIGDRPKAIAVAVALAG